MFILYDLLDVSIYSLIGIILMITGNFLIDLLIPCHFPTEIKKGNQAVGFLCAGSFIAIGTILKAAIMSPVISETKESISEGIFGSIIYFFIGVIFLGIGYYLVSLFNRKYNLNDEIGNGNTAAGIMVAGIFIGIATIISGVIM